jgi:NADPH-dependent ferric siderophore reductase
MFMSTTTSNTRATQSQFIVARAAAAAIDRISPSFVRVAFTGASLADFGTPGHTLDQRIKLIFPGSSGRSPALETYGDDWHSAWLALPEESRGSLRTYSVREVTVDDAGTTVVIDFVLHLEPGLTGPASLWASRASLGDELLLVGPRRGRIGGGVEYAPGDARTILLAGDETAAPAIARILEDVDRSVRGVAFIEVPLDADALAIDAPDGVDVRWLPRVEHSHGTALISAVLDYLGTAAAEAARDDADLSDPASDDMLWETPTFSRLGERIAVPTPRAERYFWIAGESGVVTTLRRHLVRGLGVDRAHVAFMGYWRKGVAMRG